MTDKETPTGNGAETPEKLPWMPPKISDLPRLADLTLQTGSGIPGGGGIGGGGSTVIP